MRRTYWLTAPALVLALVIACGGKEGETAPKGVTASCENVDNLSSYRYTITVKLQSPAFQTTPGAATSAPLGSFADTLAALLSDFNIDGSHVAPDRTQAVLHFQSDEVELRAIGDKRWERFGDTWEEQKLTTPEIGFLTPGVVCNEIVQEIASGLDRATAADESVNGVKTRRYTLDKTGLSKLPGLLGADAKTKLPEKFQVDVWLAKDGDWPAKLDVNAEDKDGQGKPIAVKLYMELRDFGDKTITIEAPVLNSPGR